MPLKRKWSADGEEVEEDDGQLLKARRIEAVSKIPNYKTLFHRAIQGAKRPATRKMIKRLKEAKAEGKLGTAEKVKLEMQVLETVDFMKVTEAHLFKHFLKWNSLRKSGVLPDFVTNEPWIPDGTEEEVKAVEKVVSGMLGTEDVRECLDRVMAKMCYVAGVESPLDVKNKKAKLSGKEIKKKKIESDEESLGDDDEEEEEEEEGAPGVPGEEDDSLDEEELAKYDDQLGGSSDEESFDEEELKSKRPTKPPARVSVSLSPEPSISRSPSPQPKTKKSVPKSEPRPKRPKKESKPSKESTFLPTLMGGYWSGTESEASDLDDERPYQERKNRRGQRARRAIAELKYKQNANHLKRGEEPAALMGKKKDDGWDAQRGAKDTSRPSKFSARSFGGKAWDMNVKLLKQNARVDKYAPAKVSGDNAIPLGGKREKPKVEKEGPGKSNLGVLHPSWQAAKKAKEEKKAAVFQGKKITF